jgi:hypothetical protein
MRRHSVPESTRQAFVTLLVACVALNAADLLTTALMLASPRGRAANQLDAAVYAHGGLPLFIVWKGLATAAGVLLALGGFPWLPRLPRLMVWVVALADGVLVVAVVQNVLWLGH